MQYLNKLRRINEITDSIEKDIIDAIKYLGIKTIKVHKTSGAISTSKIDPKIADQISHYVYHIKNDQLQIYCGLADKLKHLRTYGPLILIELDKKLKDVFEWIEYDKRDKNVK